MPHNTHHPGNQLPVHHPAPVVRPHIPVYQGIPGRSGYGVPAFKPHLTSTGTGNASHVQLAAHLGKLGTNVRGLSHTGGSVSTFAVLHAQSVIAAIQMELANGPSGPAPTVHLHFLQEALDKDLRILQFIEEGKKLSASHTAATLTSRQ
jgi:hypothetical protein